MARDIAVIGSGYWGKNLVRNYHALGRLGLICDRSEATLAGFREQCPGVDTCLALSDVLTHPAIRGVVVATPAETHFAVAREALLSGRHVYVEKPLVLDEAHARELIALAGARGLTLMVGHLLQYHPAFERLLAMARGGELGRINYIYSHRLNLGKIRREENALWSFAPHDISMILALTGEEPRSVLATGGNYLHSALADVTTTHLAFASGVKAHVFVSWLHPFKEQKLVVVGDRKMAVFDDTLPWADKLLLYPHSIDWKDQAPVPVRGEAERVELAQEEPLRRECLHFLRCVDEGAAPRTDGREGLAVLRVLHAAQKSMDAGCAVTGLGACPLPTGSGDYFAHETALVDPGAVVGAGTKIWHFSHVLPGSVVGARCSIGQNVVIGPDAVVGDGCKIQNNVSVYKGVTLEEDVFCGPGMVFTNVWNPRAHIRRMDQIRPTLVRRGATIGANATIVCGNTIGRYAFVGAGAVVTRDVPDHALVAGNPATVRGFVCACGEKLDEHLVCRACGAGYEQAGPGLAPLPGAQGRA
ncbi:Gfo/Idh/MocA family oxidoreductase [Desulfocurvus vexinensis]|uniref:Gfo/Idh/MocA family oxidoreductase n=1 Tax=Desulfocurvus vexinensis TaxID=399548 RepID=UPI0004ADDA43|nr:Gfo/Idh/MocA family oxidoreductase [Desulfocurvus vexinensis]